MRLSATFLQEQWGLSFRISRRPKRNLFVLGYTKFALRVVGVQQRAPCLHLTGQFYTFGAGRF